MDQTEYSVTSADIAYVYGIQASPVFSTSSAYRYTALDTLTGIGSTTAVPYDVQSPAITQMADVNITSVSILVYYQGAPGTVSGEAIMGSCLPLVTSATFNSLKFYPGSIRVPVASLIANPLRMAMTKSSPVADEFVTVTGGNGDINLPFCFLSGVPVGGKFSFLITRCFEWRPTTIAGAAGISYEKEGPSFTTELNSYADVQADVGRLETPLTTGANALTQAAPWYGDVGKVLAGSVVSSVLAMGIRHMRGLGYNALAAPDIEVGRREALHDEADRFRIIEL
jgi:hypothetical protein